MTLEENRKGYMGGLRGKQDDGKCNYNINSKN